MTRTHGIAVLFVLAAGCGAAPDETSPVTQIGQHVIPVESERSAQPAPDWKVVEQRLAEVGLGSPASFQEFVPTEGLFQANGEALFRHDSCGIASDIASIEHIIDEVSASYATYLNDYIVGGDPNDVLKTLDCDFTNHIYRCGASLDRIDFGSFGLDAKVTVVNNEFGNWLDLDGNLPVAGYVGLFTYEISCAGKDCAKEPAASLFGFLTRPQPCSGDEGVQFIH
jgi:hypothetical protein